MKGFCNRGVGLAGGAGMRPPSGAAGEEKRDSLAMGLVELVMEGSSSGMLGWPWELPGGGACLPEALDFVLA